MKNKLAIFDLDGTLFDTRSVNFLAYQKALAEEGFILGREFYESNCNGKYYKDYLPLLISNPTDELMERIHCRKKILYKSFLSYAIVNTHLFCLIELMRDTYHISLVTTASKKNTMDILEYHQKTSLFELILSQEDVTSVKPNPEGFLKAMRYFDITPEHTLIFEDSPSGIAAAKSSGASILVSIDN